MAARTYTIMDSRAVSTAITILELAAPATAALRIERAWVTQSTSTTSAQTDITVLRKTATITGTALTPVALSTGDPAAAATAKRTATVEGTDGNVLYGEGFNVLNGWVYVPVPEERLFVPPSGLIALKFPTAPPNVTYRYGITFTELN